MTTLADISLQVAQRVATTLFGVATAGSAISLTDIDNLLDPNGTWDQATLWILSGALSGRTALVSSHVGNTINFRTLGAALCARQAETLTVVGAVVNPGNATVIVTAALLNLSPKTFSVAVLGGDNASAVAGKVRTALNADSDITGFFTVGGAGADIVLTAIRALANDATMNISIANGTCTGLTAVPASANTTAGVAGPRYAVAAQDIPYNQIVSGINAAVHDVLISQENTALTGDGQTLEFTLPAGVADVFKIEMQRPGDAYSRFPSVHWQELNGKLRWDNGFPPRDGDTIHIWYQQPHADLVSSSDVVDDEVPIDWLRSQAIFNILMWAKSLYSDDPEYDIVTRLQVVNQDLQALSKRKRARVRVHSAGVPE